MSISDIPSWSADSSASGVDSHFQSSTGNGSQPQDGYEEAEEEVPLGSLSSLDEARVHRRAASLTGLR